MFVIWTEEQYRSADLDSLNARYSAIADELRNPESQVTYEDLDAEATRCKEAIDRIERAAQIALQTRAAVANGVGKVVCASQAKGEVKAADPFDTEEYRSAFVAHVTRGKQMPEGLMQRNDGTIVSTPTVTTGVAPQVPTTMQREIVSKMEQIGDIWSKVRKLTVKGGVNFRVLDLKPTATWTMKGSSKNELSTSEYQGVTADAMVSFSFYELECRMAQSLLAEAVTYDDFQAMFVPAVAEAMVKALEEAIVNGDGNAQFLGIAKDPRISNSVSMKASDMSAWKSWHSKVDAAILPEYDNGGFIMAKSTWNKYIDTLAGDDSHAVAEFHYDPVSGKRVNTLMGKPVMLVSTSILKDYDAAANGDVFAIYGDLDDYVVNTQPGMPLGTVRWIDHDANQEKVKALMAADGKVLDPHGFVLIKKDTTA